MNEAEELVNTLTHGLATLLGVFAAWVLWDRAMEGTSTTLMVGVLVYSISLVGVFAMSTASHFFIAPKWRTLFRALDQGFIYFLIVGTFTPLSIAYLDGLWWWGVLGVMWAMAIVGFVSKVCLRYQVHSASVVSYVILGWMPTFAGVTMTEAFPKTSLWWLLAGGICYTVGTVFLVYDSKVRFFHAVWHVLVIVGAAVHFLSIYRAIDSMGVSVS